MIRKLSRLKKLGLVLASLAALSAPGVIGHFTASHSNTVQAAANTTAGTIHGTQTLYNGVGGSAIRTLPNGSRWQVFSAEIASDGSQWFNLGGNQWVKDSAMNLDRYYWIPVTKASQPVSSSKSVYINTHTITLYKGFGNNAKAERQLAPGSWLVLAKADLDDVCWWYEVGNNEWVHTPGTTDGSFDDAHVPDLTNSGSSISSNQNSSTSQSNQNSNNQSSQGQSNTAGSNSSSTSSGTPQTLGDLEALTTTSYPYEDRTAYYTITGNLPANRMADLTKAINDINALGIVKLVPAAGSGYKPDFTISYSTEQLYANVNIDDGFVGGDACQQDNNIQNGMIMHSRTTAGDGVVNLSDPFVKTYGQIPDASFYVICVHELGHALGLNHNHIPGSIMYPTQPWDETVTVATDPSYAQALRQIYGM